MELSSYVNNVPKQILTKVERLSVKFNLSVRANLLLIIWDLVHCSFQANKDTAEYGHLVCTTLFTPELIYLHEHYFLFVYTIN